MLFIGKRFTWFNQYLVVGFLTFIALFVGLFFLIRYLSSEEFNLTEIQFYGSSLTLEEDLDLVREEFLGKNIFLLRTRTVEDKTTEVGSYIEEVYVEKDLPDKLEVHIVEKDPRLLLINFSNAYLIGEDFEVIDTLSEKREIRLNEQELNILNNFGDISSDYVVDRIVAKEEDLTKEEEESFISKITDKQKEEALEKIQEEISTKIEKAFSTHKEAVGESRFWHLPQVFVFDNEVLEVRGSVDKNRIKTFFGVIGLMEGMKDFEVERYESNSQFKFTVKLKGRKSFIFSTKRDFSLQEEDLSIILDQLSVDGTGFKSIDVGSEKVVVER